MADQEFTEECVWRRAVRCQFRVGDSGVQDGGHLANQATEGPQCAGDAARVLDAEDEPLHPATVPPNARADGSARPMHLLRTTQLVCIGQPQQFGIGSTCGLCHMGVR